MGSVPSGWAAPPAGAPTSPPVPASPQGEIHRQELALLHLPVDRAALRALPLWDLRTQQVRDERPAEGMDDSTPILVLHLWATWCVPCREDFPIWRELGPRLTEQHRGRVHVFYIAMQNKVEDMADFISQLRGGFPGLRLYLDRDERLARSLGKALEYRELPLPITLWLDPQRVVRQALVGSINHRRSEVIDGTARLMQLVRFLETHPSQSQPPLSE